MKIALSHEDIQDCLACYFANVFDEPATVWLKARIHHKTGEPHCSAVIEIDLGIEDV